MKHCKLCKINANTNLDYCPLCFNELDEKEKTDDLPEYLLKTKEDKTNRNSYFLMRVFLFITVAVMTISAFINFLTYEGVVWSLLITTCLIYVWVLVGHTIISNRSPFEKILFQIIGIVAVLISSYVVSGGGDWLINFVLPSVAICTTTILTMILLINKRRGNFLFSFIVIYILLVVFSSVLLLAKFDTFKMLNQINLFYNILVIIGSLLFGFKTIKNDFSKKLHL